MKRSRNMVFGVKNSRIFVLSLVLAASTLIASILQFVKGNLFQSAIEGNWSSVKNSILLMCILIVSEVSFYLIERTYENIILRDALASHKKGVIQSAFNIHKFNNINKDKEDKLNLL